METKAETNGLKHLGIISTNQIAEWMNSIHCLRPMVILLKHKLSEKGLNETYFGGINTYSLMVMLVAYILDRNLQESKTISDVFEKVLGFYAYDFDAKKYAIDLRNYRVAGKKIFTEKSEEGEGSKASSELEIRDPLNDGKVMTRNCYKFDQIRVIMREILE